MHDGTLLFTGDNGIPLIRYHIADTGGLTPFDAMLAFLARRVCAVLRSVEGLVFSRHALGLVTSNACARHLPR